MNKPKKNTKKERKGKKKKRIGLGGWGKEVLMVRVSPRNFILGRKVADHVTVRGSVWEGGVPLLRRM